MSEQYESNGSNEYQLNDADKAAVDAIFEGAGADADRMDRVTRLMELLDTPMSDDGQRGARIDVVSLRASAAGTNQYSIPHRHPLLTIGWNQKFHAQIAMRFMIRWLG